MSCSLGDWVRNPDEPDLTLEGFVVASADFIKSFDGPPETLSFTPAITWTFNLDDRSFFLAPECVYTGITNTELRLEGVPLAGEAYTEFGEKPNDYRIEVRARYYF